MVPTCVIHGMKINLTEIQKLHPGGSIAISLAENQDISVLFDQYHFGSSVKKQLDSTHAHPKSTFYSELYGEMKKLPSLKITTLSLVLNSLVAVGAGVSWFGWLSGSVLSCLLLPFFQWLFFVNVGHEAGHFALSKFPIVNHTACLLSHFLFVNTTQWYLQHTVSHHSHTNEINKDFDLYHFFPLLRMHSLQRWNSRLEYKFEAALLVTWVTSTFAESIVYPWRMLRGSAKKTLGDSSGILRTTWISCIAQLTCSIGILILPFFTQKSLIFALFFALYPYVIGSILFMAFTQVSHINPHAQSKPKWNHWSEQMVDTSLDYSQDSRFWTFVSGGLNMQSLHHCLPSLSCSRYREFYPTYRKLCEKHKLKIHETKSLFTAMQLYALHIKHLSIYDDEKYLN